ncbi:MAG: ribbon-helix-helix protein, CopG family [Chloroflexi bacterium]|nr:ribbon-helix-helix protein, CopG family [Chloroflexota bacterium]
MKTLTVQCPDQLIDRLEELTREGWVSSPEQAALEALRRFLESHETSLIEEQVLRDVEWGLRGHE